MLLSKSRLASLALCIWVALCFGNARGFELDKLQQSFFNRYGHVISGELFTEWMLLMRTSRNIGEREKLQRVNAFFNNQISFEEDYSLWDKPDYWATPLETLARGRGDCEDYAIAKYFSLLELGMPINKLRLIYVRATISDPDGSRIKQSHIVLAYYPSLNVEPLILDNLNKNILSASQRPDLLPVFSFNSASFQMDPGKSLSMKHLSRWQDLLTRSRVEGFQ